MLPYTELSFKPFNDLYSREGCNSEDHRYAYQRIACRVGTLAIFGIPGAFGILATSPGSIAEYKTHRLTSEVSQSLRAKMKDNNENSLSLKSTGVNILRN